MGEAFLETALSFISKINTLRNGYHLNVAMRRGVGSSPPNRFWTWSWDSRKIRWEVWTDSGGGRIGDEYGKEWKWLRPTWLFLEDLITNVIIYRGIKGAICIHDRDPKRKIYVVFFGFWGLRSQTPAEAPPLDLAGGLPSPRPLELCPPNLWLLATPLRCRPLPQENPG